jgi:hypothetical protein
MNFQLPKVSVSVKLLVALGAMGAAGVASASLFVDPGRYCPAEQPD